MYITELYEGTVFNRTSSSGLLYEGTVFNRTSSSSLCWLFSNPKNTMDRI